MNTPTSALAKALFDDKMVNTRIVLAASEFLWAVLLLWPGDTFARPTYGHMAMVMVEEAWGVVQASTNGVLGVPSPDAALSYGFPVLRFESSLKVEVKCSGLSGTAADKQCGVTYRLDL